MSTVNVYEESGGKSENGLGESYTRMPSPREVSVVILEALAEILYFSSGRNYKSAALKDVTEMLDRLWLADDE